MLAADRLGCISGREAQHQDSDGEALAHQFTAIINPPEVAILTIGTATDTVVPGKDGFEVRKKLRVTMSCDHRAVDGAVGAAFLQTLRRMIENPLMLAY